MISADLCYLRLWLWVKTLICGRAYPTRATPFVAPPCLIPVPLPGWLHVGAVSLVAVLTVTSLC